MSLTIPASIRRKMIGLDQTEAQHHIDVITANIDNIYEEKASNTDYRKLYDMAFTLVTNQNGQKLYDAVKHTIEKHTAGLSEQVDRQSDEFFMHRLLAEWEKFRKSVSIIRDVLLYLDENYVDKTQDARQNIARAQTEWNANDEPLLTIYNCGVQIFKESVLLRLAQRVQRLMISMIQQERNGERVSDKFLIKNLTQMMVEVDKEQVYVEMFEKKFLAESHAFYKREAQKIFNENTVVEYLRCVKRRLKEEVERNDRCLDPDTRPKIENVIKEEMIEKYKDLVAKKEGSGVVVMLENHKRDELKLAYEILGLVRGALDPTIEMTHEYAKREGLKIVTDSRKDESQPLNVVMEIINLRVDFDDLLLDSFSTYTTTSGVPGSKMAIVLGRFNANTATEKLLVRDKEFSKAITEAFDHVVNYNERFAEYLSLLLDTKLTKGSTQTTVQTEEQLDIFLDRVVMILRHVREKDVFEKYYKNHLARRLLGSRSASDDDEKIFLTKLKTEFGYQFTSKLEGMFKDVKVSNDLMKNWKEQQEQQDRKINFDLNVKVLTHVYWPLTGGPKCDLLANDNTNEIIQQLAQSCELFTQFYVDQHNGRKLTWQYNMGDADLRVNGFARVYEFNVSTFQMAILLLFNNDDKMTLDEDGAISLKDMEQLTKIPMVDLKRSLVSLLLPVDKNLKQSTILLRITDEKEADEIKDSSVGGEMRQGNGGGAVTIGLETRFKCNDNFESKKIKNKVKSVSKKQTKEEQKETNEKINEERKWVTDAVIVRIMKMRKKMEHRALVHEVVEQLHHRFPPTSQFIKRRIDNLIEREYIARLEGDRQMYNYLA